MRASMLAGMAVLAWASLAASPAARAQDDTCSRLWVERNAIYKNYGYCFKTARAINYFGNAGCRYDRERDVPLSRQDRAQINQIIAEERALGCR